MLILYPEDDPPDHTAYRQAQCPTHGHQSDIKPVGNMILMPPPHRRMHNCAPPGNGKAVQFEPCSTILPCSSSLGEADVPGMGPHAVTGGFCKVEPQGLIKEHSLSPLCLLKLHYSYPAKGGTDAWLNCLTLQKFLVLQSLLSLALFKGDRAGPLAQINVANVSHPRFGVLSQCIYILMFC